MTGSNGGIGSAIASLLGRTGYNVVLNVHVREDRIALIRKDLGDDRTLVLRADITDDAQVNQMVWSAIKRFGRIDVLVNCAGILRDKTLAKQSRKEWSEVLDVNLNGAFNVTKAVLPSMMEQRGGTIISISSVVGEIGNFGQTNYAASKAALIGFTKSLAKEVASKGITVNAIAPGFASTEMTDNLPPDIKSKLLASIPMGRFARPEEIAEAASFLCNARYITGTVLDINGGLA